MEETKSQVTCVLRLFGASAEAVQKAVNAQRGVRAQCMTRGGETLAALCADKPADLEKAETRLRAALPNDLYGKGAESLAAVTVAALEKHDRLLTCADAETGALLEQRLESIEGASRVFDFGALSYAEEKTRAKIEEQVCRRAGGKDTFRQELARVQAALHFVGAEIAAGSVKRAGDTVLIVGTRKSCWVRAVPAGDKPGLWLLDMVRRAACGLKQAEGTLRQNYRKKLCLPNAAPQPQAAPRKKHRLLRRAPVLLLLLVLLGVAGAWYVTGGDLAALPQTLGLDALPHSGAALV